MTEQEDRERTKQIAEEAAHYWLLKSEQERVLERARGASPSPKDLLPQFLTEVVPSRGSNDLAARCFLLGLSLGALLGGIIGVLSTQ